MDSEHSDVYLDQKQEKFYSRISLWASFLLSTLVVVWYYTGSPPDSPEVREMRLFFNKHKMDVGTFLGLPRGEQKKFAARKKHPFYANYLKASEVKKGKIRALAHISYDYTPYQYWFNLVFLWMIFFTALWFVGLMVEGAIILVRKKAVDRKKKSAGS
ncbi:MAG: hypothetical protein V3U37_00280 [Nitrospinaceae bacterium]